MLGYWLVGSKLTQGVSLQYAAFKQVRECFWFAMLSGAIDYYPYPRLLQWPCGKYKITTVRIE